jgi:hypothetical protein
LRGVKILDILMAHDIWLVANPQSCGDQAAAICFAPAGIGLAGFGSR